ncbi:uncharacterized protein LOC128676072 [Plodia interpunctella]|uniref:uncharacterized protein LOC128676072 n=1 Tax=Plodia interpunctella TaxID=58824 RepID=UPI002368A52B|nr:uncharacterized protein LOC128676072 [Plodia interpunctella]
MSCKYYTEAALGWILNNKMIVFLGLLSFCLFVSTLALAGQRNRYKAEVEELKSSTTVDPPTDATPLPPTNALNLEAPLPEKNSGEITNAVIESASLMKDSFLVDEDAYDANPLEKSVFDLKDSKLIQVLNAFKMVRCRYYTELTLGWMLNHKMIVFLGLLSFCLFVSTLSMAAQRNRYKAEIDEILSSTTVEPPTVEPTTEVPTTEVTTETPTEVPTETPTEVPTETPTEVPTETPTEVPTETPTEVTTETTVESTTDITIESTTDITTEDTVQSHDNSSKKISDETNLEV